MLLLLMCCAITVMMFTLFFFIIFSFRLLVFLAFDQRYNVLLALGKNNYCNLIWVALIPCIVVLITYEVKRLGFDQRYLRAIWPCVLFL